MNEYDTFKNRLLDDARAARLHSYSPYSNFAVGAAILSRSRKSFIAANVENISYSLTICAERVAVCSAIAAGERDFIALAVVTGSEEPIVPCGACRQFLAEFNSDLTIISETLDRQQKVEQLSELLPHPKRGIL